MLESDQFWMEEALKQAHLAKESGEVPVGAVLVIDNQLAGAGYNRPIAQQDPTAHAEIIAIRQAAQNVKNYRLLNSTLYVTLEPCAMCAGAMIHARVSRLVFAAKDPRAGAVGSVFNILNEQRLNHQVSWSEGVLSDTCSILLKEFFRSKRKNISSEILA